MNKSLKINDYPVLIEYIGSCADDSSLVSDLEGLKDILPELVRMRPCCCDVDRAVMDAAIQCIGFTIANLKDLRRELLS